MSDNTSGAVPTGTANAPAPATTSATAPSPGAAPASKSQRLRRFILLVLVPLAVCTALGFIYLRGGHAVETDNAYVKADKVPVSSEVSGTVKETLVQDNQLVEAGQLLFRLDSAPFMVAQARAQARLAQVRQDHAQIRASYREKQAEIALARSRHAYALRDQQRQADLIARNFISAARFDDARQGTEIAQEQIDTLEQGLRRIAESLGGSIDTPVESLPAYRAAMAELAQANLDLARTEVRATQAGTVSKPPKPGQFLGAGSLAMALVVNGRLWIEANFPETDLTHVRPGQPVSIRIDTYPEASWRGEVESLSPATGAEFSLIPAQNATGNWVKIAQRVPVRIRLDSTDQAPALRAGLSAVVSIETGHRRSLFGLSL